MAWRIDENGEPDDMPVADPMGPVSRWQELGEDVAGSLWVKTLAEIYPDPPLIYFLENNEGARRYTYGDYWLAVADSVREIHENDTLRKFWLEGAPVINPDPAGHYFKWELPDGIIDNRWQLLDCDANPPRAEWPKKLGHMDLAVYAIAYRLPEEPAQYLVYAWSPVGDVKNAVVEIPDFGSITIDPSVHGQYYLVTLTAPG